MEKKKEKINNEFFKSIQRSGYDRCRRGFTSVFSILNEQKMKRTSRRNRRIKDRK